MILQTLNILNYRNIEEARLELSPNINCFVGANGMGKTNLLDAIYYLSFCRSTSNAMDSQNIRHGESFFMLEGNYEMESGTQNTVVCSVKAGSPKRIEKDGKRLRRISEHIGSIPLVYISPADSTLVTSFSDERRRFIDSTISQYDPQYLESLIRYEKALKQRNALLKMEQAEPDWDVVGVLEDIMSVEAERIYSARKDFTEQFVPLFKKLYQQLCTRPEEAENAEIEYHSQLSRGELKAQLLSGRAKERILGHTLHGTHRDDLHLTLGGYPLKYEGSQGQTKTYVIALKLAQYLHLKAKGDGRIPLLLLDDIFDKLDASRVAQLVRLASADTFGQTFITDTDRSHIDLILNTLGGSHRHFTVKGGAVTPAPEGTIPSPTPTWNADSPNP